MAKKGTKAYREEYTWVYWGIEHDTFKLRSVYQSRDGMLHSSSGGTHYVAPGQTARTEVMLAFHLFEIRSLPISSDETRVVEELKAIAAQKKAEKEALEGTT